MMQKSSLHVASIYISLQKTLIACLVCDLETANLVLLPVCEKDYHAVDASIPKQFLLYYLDTTNKLWVTNIPTLSTTCTTTCVGVTQLLHLLLKVLEYLCYECWSTCVFCVAMCVMSLASM